MVFLVDTGAPETGIEPYEIGAAGNHNLLDNWYFLDPINQRGKTEYTGAVYGIDRWLNNTLGMTSTVEADGGVTLSANGSLLQRLTGFALYKGKTFTLSILTKDGMLVTGTGSIPSDASGFANAIAVSNNAVSVVFGYNSAKNWAFVSLASTDVATTFAAVKLELGSVQTLAHQDASGNWVLNDPPPNKQQELAKCQRYQFVMPRLRFKYDNSANASDVFLPLMFPTAMRIAPTITHDAVNGVSVVSDYDTTHALLQISPSAFVDCTLTNIIFDANL